MEVAPHSIPPQGALHHTRDARAFRAMVFVSVAAHVVAVVAFAIVQAPPPREIKTQEAIQTKLVRLGKKEQDWLPRVATPPPPPKQEAAVIAPADDKAVEIKKTPAKDDNKSKFDDVLKRLNDLEKREAKDDYKGKGDPTGSKAGTVSDFTKQTIGNQWVADCQEKIKPNWLVPSVIDESQRAGLAVVILLYVAPTGRVLKRSVEKSSGNDMYDRSVLQAIDKTSPLPAPPEEIREAVQKDGIEVTFSGRKG